MLSVAQHPNSPRSDRPANPGPPGHPAEIAGLLYIEAPVMLDEVLVAVVAYNRKAMAQGSMWWWILRWRRECRNA